MVSSELKVDLKVEVEVEVADLSERELALIESALIKTAIDYFDKCEEVAQLLEKLGRNVPAWTRSNAAEVKRDRVLSKEVGEITLPRPEDMHGACDGSGGSDFETFTP